MIPLALFALALGLFVFALRTDRRGWRMGAAVAAVALWPVASVAVASGAAEALGCVVHEAGAQPCPSALGDVGGPLNTAFVSGWAMLATLPLGLALGLVWLLVWRRSAR